MSGQMSGIDARRNDPGFWVKPIRWTRIRARTKPVCDDCLINTHEAGGTNARLRRAVWSRSSGERTREDRAAWEARLCEVHRDEWLGWSLGQTAIGLGPA